MAECVQLEDLAIGNVEGAIEGSRSAFDVICPSGRWSVIELGRLSAEDLQIITLARRRGYLVACGADPWPAWHAWQLLCQLSGECAVCAWQRRGQRGSIVELQMPCGAQLGAAAQDLWTMAAEYAGMLSGGPGWMIAEGIPVHRVEQLAAAIAEMAHTGAIGDGAG